RGQHNSRSKNYKVHRAFRPERLRSEHFFHCVPRSRARPAPRRCGLRWKKRKKMALTSFLPAPTQLSQDQLEAEERARSQRSRQTSLVSSRREPPPYGYRKGWIPRLLEDFGDGGAFPEIHVAQYPLDMGRKKKMSNALAIQVDPEGKIKYDAIARQGQSKDKVTSHWFR
ncbi:SNW domain-containing protein 1-like, partial [Peromyscus leucopus]|uniref:SNW domain-containing protein 1-like n=1 Tax=Peromyscus leucopus TaxID=10041 RepID=UPI001884EB3E